jgi:hypothetical protein
MSSIPVPDNWCMEDGWVIDDDKIRLYLDYMHQHEYAYVSKNRRKYPECVQSIIAEYDIPQVIKIAKNSKLKIKDLSDYDMYVASEKEKARMIEAIAPLWNETRITYSLRRPRNYNDTRRTRIDEILRLKNEKLSNEIASLAKTMPKRYGSIAKRTELAIASPSLNGLRNEIKILENESLKICNQQIQDDYEWAQSSIYELAIMCEV